MKKILALLLAVVMVLALVACATSEKPADDPAPTTEPSKTEEPTTEEKDGGYRLMLSNAYYTAPYCAAYNPSAKETAEALGCTLDIMDGEGNQQKQLEQANLAISEKYDGFLYFPADVDGALPVIEALNASDIAWVGVNAYTGDKIEEVGMDYYVGPDAYSHGVTQANTLMDMFPDGCNYVVIAGTAGHMQTIYMDQAMDELLDSSKYVRLDYQNCDFSAEIAMTKAADMITAYGLACSGGQIDCVVVQDGGMSTGVISALEAAGYQPGDVKFIAMGSNQVLYDAMVDGWLSASSTQDPVAEGKLAVETLYGVLEGTATKGWTKLPTPVAYPETKDDFSWFE